MPGALAVGCILFNAYQNRFYAINSQYLALLLVSELDPYISSFLFRSDISLYMCNHMV